MSIDFDLTTKTPGVRFDTGSGHLKIFGRSLPENATEFYRPLMEEIDKYKEAPKESTTIQLALEYFNTSTSRILLDIIRSLAWLEQSGKTHLKVKWFFETNDWDMEDAGNEYKQILANLDFDVLETEKFDHRDLS